MDDLYLNNFYFLCLYILQESARPNDVFICLQSGHMAWNARIAPFISIYKESGALLTLLFGDNTETVSPIAGFIHGRDFQSLTLFHFMCNPVILMT